MSVNEKLQLAAARGSNLPCGTLDGDFHLFGQDVQFSDNTDVDLNVTFPGPDGEETLSCMIYADDEITNPRSGTVTVKVDDSYIGVIQQTGEWESHGTITFFAV